MSPDSKSPRLLAFLAHPDDAEILAGGTLLHLKDHGWELGIATMTAGDCGSATTGREEIARLRRAEAQAAAGVPHWAEPVCVIEREQAEPVLLAASAISAGSKPSFLDSAGSVQMWSDSLRGCFRCTAVVANNRIVDFLRSARALGMSSEGEGIPPEVAFEFMATVLYISENDTSTGLLM